MTAEVTPYIECKPGDLITAEGCNEIQRMIKKDIGAQVDEAKQKLIKEGVQRADNSDEFAGKTPDEWKTDLDGRYAPKTHDHEGPAYYQRYFLEMETVLKNNLLQPAVIIHNMGRHPLVQVYELIDLPINKTGLTTPYKFVVCGPEHAEDDEAIKFVIDSWDERHFGDALDDVLTNLAAALAPEARPAFWKLFQPQFTLNAWLTKLAQFLFEPGPAQYHFDQGDIYRTQWVKDREKTPVEQLQKQGEWAPRLVYVPGQLSTSPMQNSQATEKEAIKIEPKGGGGVAEVTIGIGHINLNEVIIWPKTDQVMRLMVLLRG